MKFIPFNGCNITLGPPEGWDEEKCKSIRAMKGEDADGPFYVVSVQPSEEDRQAIAAGAAIFISTRGQSFAPISVFTINSEAGLANAE